ncbi:hypothetical protein DDI_3063 [Dickeya dianthicola RNS04.9]|nr:hypothetical protein DDI_3063 [Dickeya dianthicola RNS04.9]
MSRGLAPPVDSGCLFFPHLIQLAELPLREGNIVDELIG